MRVNTRARTQENNNFWGREGKICIQKNKFLVETSKNFERKIEKTSRIQRLFSSEKIFFSAEEKFFARLKFAKKHTKTTKNKSKKIGFCKVFKRKNRKFLLKNPLKK